MPQASTTYASPLGEMILTADDLGLTGLWFVDQKNAPSVDADAPAGTDALWTQARNWLDRYFAGQEPDFMPPLHLLGTAFQLEVWEILKCIPYGSTTSYGAIARELAARRGLPRMSAQAVGQAVGRNPLAIMIPCHRVLGSTGKLTGYAGGLDKKIFLLRLEGVHKEV